jgi:phosphoesterase RecJ-like protein
MSDGSTRPRSTLARLLAFLEAPGLKLLTGHLRPDGDALGAAIGLARALVAQGHQAVVAAEPADLGLVRFLEGSENVVTPAAAAELHAVAFVSLDCGTATRLPEPLHPLLPRLPVANIDHHRTNTRFGQVNWIDPHASSTSEMVWRLIRHAGWKLDRAAAEALWTGVITDTGRFAYDQTSPRTLRCGADLLRYGVRTAWINDRIYGTVEKKALELRRRAFQSLECWAGDRVTVVSLSRDDFAAAGATKADAEDIIEIPRSLRGSQVALFLYQAGDEQVTRLSIRTREPLDATQLALRYGGGGHARAAGCTVHASLRIAREQVKRQVEEWLAEQSAAAAAQPLPDAGQSVA